MIQRSPELAAVLRRFLTALEERNEASIRSLVSTSEQTSIIGSDPREWYVGDNAVDLLLIQSKGLPVFRYEIERLEAFEVEGFGWAVADVKAHLQNAAPVSLRTTAVFSLDRGIWKVVHLHTSAPQPDQPEVIGLELSQTMERLLGSLDSEADLAAVRDRLRTSTVTIVFTDLEDSTRRSAETGDQRWSDLMSAHFASLESIAEDHFGVLVKTLGDGAMIAFESAHSAVRATAAMHDATSDVVEAAGARLRIGVHTGETVRSQSDYFGQTVNIAARLVSAAEPGTTLVSEVVHDLIAASGEVEFGEPLRLELKGVTGVQTAYPVLAISV